MSPSGPNLIAPSARSIGSLTRASLPSDQVRLDGANPCRCLIRALGWRRSENKSHSHPAPTGSGAGLSNLILETRGLTKEFRGFAAVRGVDLKVRRGTIHALIGPNGAGKTTVFNLLTKFLEPTAGQISFNGRDITGANPAAVARLGLVRSFQISAVFPHLTLLENVRLALQRPLGTSFQFWRSGKSLDRLNGAAEALLADVGLGGYRALPAG